MAKLLLAGPLGLPVEHLLPTKNKLGGQVDKDCKSCI
jgi:hypothetical protein